MKNLLTIFTLLQLTSCAHIFTNIPKGFEGAAYQCSFSQQCVDDYVAETKQISQMSLEEIILLHRVRGDSARQIQSFGSGLEQLKTPPQPQPAVPRWRWVCNVHGAQCHQEEF